MKRFIAILLLAGTLLSLVGCNKNKYPPVESTAEERKTVLTLSYEGQSFEVPYELYRTLFYTYKEDFDGGDNSRWEGEGAKILTESIQNHIYAKIYEIYSVFAICKMIDFDLYSKAVEEKIQEFIAISVEGGMLGQETITGFEGDYDAYLASLAEAHTNYSVQVLLFRYMIGKNAISEHYTEGSTYIPEVTREELYTFYQKEDTVRVLRLFLSADIFSIERAEEIAYSFAELEGEEAIARAMIGYTTLAGPEIENGSIITPYNLDALTYAELTEEAMRLSMYEVSTPIYCANGGNDGYFILYRADKSDAHFDACYNTIVQEYLEDKIGRQMNEVQSALRESIVTTDFLKGLNHGAI